MAKTISKQLLIFLFIASLCLIVPATFTRAAESGDTSDIVTGVLEGAKGTGLPGYCPGCSSKDGSKPHELSSYYSGATELTSIFLYAVDFLKYIIGAIAVLYIVISSIKLISAGYKVDEVITQEKETLKWIMIGLLVVFVADKLVFDVFFGQEGEVLQDQDTATDFALSGSQLIRGLYNFLLIFISYIAVLGIVINGVRIVIFAFDSETLKNAMKYIIWCMAALVFVGLAELIVKIVFPYFPPESADEERDFFIDTGTAKKTLAMMTGYLASFIGIMSVAAMTYAGYLYVAFFGQDDYLEKAKKIIKNALYGIIIAGGAYGIVATFTSLNAR